MNELQLEQASRAVATLGAKPPMSRTPPHHEHHVYGTIDARAGAASDESLSDLSNGRHESDIDQLLHIPPTRLSASLDEKLDTVSLHKGGSGSSNSTPPQQVDNLQQDTPPDSPPHESEVSEVTTGRKQVACQAGGASSSSSRTATGASSSFSSRLATVQTGASASTATLAGVPDVDDEEDLDEDDFEDDDDVEDDDSDDEDAGGQIGGAASKYVGLDVRSPAWSVGSVLHEAGTCRPCAWFWKVVGCTTGESCQFCHQCGPGVFQLKTAIRRAERVAELRAMQRRMRGRNRRARPVPPGLVGGAAYAKGSAPAGAPKAQPTSGRRGARGEVESAAASSSGPLRL